MHTQVHEAAMKCLFGTGGVNEFSLYEHLSVIKVSCAVITAAVWALTSLTSHLISILYCLETARKILVIMAFFFYRKRKDQIIQKSILENVTC